MKLYDFTVTIPNDMPMNAKFNLHEEAKKTAWEQARFEGNWALGWEVWHKKVEYNGYDVIHHFEVEGEYSGNPITHADNLNSIAGNTSGLCAPSIPIEDKPTLTFEVGKSYKTRNGLKATVIKNDLKGSLPIVCSTESLNEENPGIIVVSSQGKYDPSSIYDNEFDLVEEWEEVVKIKGWFNIYSSKGAVVNTRREHYVDGPFYCKEDANKGDLYNERVACVYGEL